MSERQMARPTDSLWMSLLAMVFFIIWGLWVNWEYGFGSRIQVALTQGVVSFVSTLFSAELIVWLGKRMAGKRWAVFWTGAFSWLLFYTLITMAHFLAGTPELLATMLPGMITGVFFCFGYALRVQRFLEKV
ncbi:MAG: hypothetical protein ABF328_03505 [Akkermansiaceae bacterium]